ncbi:MAG: hypothetical protein K0R17_2733 [Rariglobus sp.]|jgi:hypothetical protein|nr:hypothetical protein [Rariglobus sp.]
MIRFCSSLTFAFFAALATLAAQTGPVAPAVDESTTFRIMTTVGSATDLRFDPRPGTEPVPLMITRSPSKRYSRPPGDKLVLYRLLPVPPDAPAGTKPVKDIAAEIPLPAEQVALIIVVAPLPNEKLAAKVLTDDSKKHPAGALRIINLSDMPAMVALNETRHEAAPASSMIVPQGTGGILVQVAVANTGGWSLAFRKERLARPELHSYGFIFNYAPDPELGLDPTPPPAIVRIISEKAPAPPEKARS